MDNKYKNQFNMTDRVTPVQMEMLMLAGLIPFNEKAPMDDEYWKVIKAVRINLTKRSGHDFGYDLLAWHNYFLSNPKHGYLFPQYETVHEAVMSMVGSEWRKQLINAHLSMKPANEEKEPSVNTSDP